MQNVFFFRVLSFRMIEQNIFHFFHANSPEGFFLEFSKVFGKWKHTGIKWCMGMIVKKGLDETKTGVEKNKVYHDKTV